MRTKPLIYVSYLCLIGMLLVQLHPVAAKGQIGKVVVSGPGISDSLEIEERQTLNALLPGALEDFASGAIIVPSSVGIGYDLVRYMDEPDGRLYAFDQLRYFPGKADELGTLFYVGLNGDGLSTYQGKWYKATEKGDAALRKLLAPILAKPAPQTRELARAPQDCTDVATPEGSSPLSQPAVKVSPTSWVTGFGTSAAILKLTADASELAPNVRGWGGDLHWFIETDTYMPVTVWVRDLTNNAPVWFDLPDGSPSTVLTLLPKSASLSNKTWAEFPTTLYVSAAGCYAVEAHWSHYRSTFVFAAGL